MCVCLLGPKNLIICDAQGCSIGNLADADSKEGKQINSMYGLVSGTRAVSYGIDMLHA